MLAPGPKSVQGTWPVEGARWVAALSYDGAAFHGWQRQAGPSVPTVQHALEHALSQVANTSVQVHAAGRTDRGVHALEQVVHWDTTADRRPDQWLRGVNAHLPSTVQLRWVRPVGASFHARFSALTRHYRYVLSASDMPPVWSRSHVTWLGRHRSSLDLAAMRAVATSWCGFHDFSAFRGTGCQSRHPFRWLHRITLGQHGALLWVDVVADGFLYHMVRLMVQALCMVGWGEVPVQEGKAWLTAGWPGAHRAMLSPEGLFFVQARYPPAFMLPSPCCKVGDAVLPAGSILGL